MIENVIKFYVNKKYLNHLNQAFGDHELRLG